jgi:MOSC domain-containing protein
MLELTSRISGPPQGTHNVLIEDSGRTLTTSADSTMNRRISEYLGGKLELVRFPRFAETRVRSGRTLHLLTTASLESMRELYPGGDFQVRRFRPNIVVETENGAEGFVEDTWIGKDVRVGSIRMHVHKPNIRCKVTTLGQPGIVEDPLILDSIQKGHESSLGVMCNALEEGDLRVGDPVVLP